MYIYIMKNIFTEHLNSVSESYLQHFGFALRTGFNLIKWGLAAIVHGFFPFLFTTYVSKNINALYEQINNRT